MLAWQWQQEKKKINSIKKILFKFTHLIIFVAVRRRRSEKIALVASKNPPDRRFVLAVHIQCVWKQFFLARENSIFLFEAGRVAVKWEFHYKKIERKLKFNFVSLPHSSLHHILNPLSWVSSSCARVPRADAICSKRFPPIYGLSSDSNWTATPSRSHFSPNSNNRKRAYNTDLWWANMHVNSNSNRVLYA